MGELPKAIHVCKKSLTRFRHKSGEQSVLEMWASFYLLREDVLKLSQEPPRPELSTIINQWCAQVSILPTSTHASWLEVAERSGDDKARVRLQTGIASLYAKAGQFSEAEE
eukprot:5471093-Amphidinium_carterae.1